MARAIKRRQEIEEALRKGRSMTISKPVVIQHKSKASAERPMSMEPTPTIVEVDLTSTPSPKWSPNLEDRFLINQPKLIDMKAIETEERLVKRPRLDEKEDGSSNT